MQFSPNYATSFVACRKHEVTILFVGLDLLQLKFSILVAFRCTPRSFSTSGPKADESH